MSDFENPFDEVVPVTPKPVEKPKQAQSRQFESGLDGVSRSDVAKAAKKSTMQGQYWQRTMRLPPQFQDLTREIYQNEPMASSIAEVERWVYAMGLKAYFEEGKRPEYQREVTRQIDMPAIKEQEENKK